MSDYYDDLVTMFRDIFIHSMNNGNAIVSADYPKALLLGWCCENTGKLFQIKLGTIRRCPDLLRKHIQSSSNRIELCNFFNGKDFDLDPQLTALIPHFKKFEKLKAFL